MVNWSSSSFYHLVQKNFAFIHQTSILTAAALYIISSLLAVSARSDHHTVLLARLVLYNAVVLLSLAETLRIIKSWQLQNKFTLGVFAIEFAGYCNLAMAAMTEELYNRGAWFMVSSFLISVAKEMGIILLLFPKNQINTKRYHFLGCLNSCCSALLFFFGALVGNFWGDEFERHLISSTLNVMSGILLGMAVFYTVKAQHYEGYTNMPVSLGD